MSLLLPLYCEPESETEAAVDRDIESAGVRTTYRSTSLALTTYHSISLLITSLSISLQSQPARLYGAKNMRVYPELSASSDSLDAIAAKVDRYSSNVDSGSRLDTALSIENGQSGIVRSINDVVSSSEGGLAKADNAERASNAESWFKGKRVLVVDDGKEPC